MTFRGHVALPALRRSTGRDSALLGLPAFFDHLFDLPALPSLAGGRPRLLRQGPGSRPADGARAAPVLGGGRSRPDLPPGHDAGRFRARTRASPRDRDGSSRWRAARSPGPDATPGVRPARRADAAVSGAAGRGAGRGADLANRHAGGPTHAGRRSAALGAANQPLRRRRPLGERAAYPAGQVATGCSSVVRLISAPGWRKAPGAGSCATTIAAGSFGPDTDPTSNPSFEISLSASASSTHR